MKKILTRANLLARWRKTEGSRGRAVWIDGPDASRDHLERSRRHGADGSVRRII